MSELKYFVDDYQGVHFDEDVVLPLGRAAFCDLVDPNTKYENPSWGLTILLDKSNDQTIAELKKNVQPACQAIFQQLAEMTYEKVPAAKRKTLTMDAHKKDLLSKMADQPMFRDGDDKEYDGFPGNYYIVARNSKANGFTILDDKHGSEIEPGMIVRAQVVPRVSPKGFSFKLKLLRLIKDDGVRFNKGGKSPDLISGLDEAVAAVTINSKESEPSVEAALDKAVSGTTLAGLDILG